MGAVPAVDTDALIKLKAFTEACQAKGITVLLAHVNPQPKKAMDKFGLSELVQENNFCKNIYAAIEQVKTL